MLPALEVGAMTRVNVSDQELLKLFHLSNRVFNPSLENDSSHAGQLPEWEKRISQPHSILLRISKPDASFEPLGFVFAFPRTQPAIGKELLHLWVAAVDPASRGLGIFPMLMDRLKQHARECGYQGMTVCTYPERFEKMYRILNQHGWTVVAWLPQEEGAGRKVLMMTPL